MMINKAIINVKIRNSSSANEIQIFMINSEINSVRAANIEPSDTNLLNKTVNMNTNNASATGMGISAIKTPADVATPLPPLNFRKIGIRGPHNPRH